jgi:hypothetical protein
VGSRTTWADLLTQYADNTSGQITAERLRNFVQSARPHVTTSAPTVNSDETAGFDRGHGWLDTTGPTLYECVDPAAGAAVWAQVYPQANGGGGASELSDLSDVDTEYAVNGDVLRYQAGAWSPDALGSAADADTGDFATAAQGALADTAVQPAREVATQHSLTGGGDLSTDRTLSLVNDAATPGANKVYGTDGAGARGWKDDPAGGGGGGDIALADGLVVVPHGDDANVTRPAAGTVYWQGSVDPTNRELGDLWLETTAYDGS